MKGDLFVAQFTTYAEILDADHPMTRAYKSGVFKSEPGLTLREVFKYTDEDDNYLVYISASMRKDLLRVGGLSNDQALLELAEKDAYPVSVKHPRSLPGTDLDKTRIVLGHRLNYTHEESLALRDEHAEPPDPRRSFAN